MTPGKQRKTRYESQKAPRAFLGAFSGRHEGKREKRKVDMKTGKKGLWEPLWYVLYAFAGLGLELLLAGVIEPLWTKGKGFSQYTAGDDAVTCESIPKTSGV